jgi:inorganic triphosphatase YgiF
MGVPGSEEVELKFGVAGERLPALREALKAGAVRSERLRAIYFDTPDERLSRAGAALRLRREGRRWLQTLKVSTGDALRRLEHESGVPAPAKGEEPALDRSRHVGTPAGVALEHLLGGESLAPVARFRTDVRRLMRSVRVGGARIELALDVGAAVAGERVEPLQELELELKSGSVEGLIAAARRWLQPHGLWFSTVTKAERGARLARGEAPRAVPASALDVDPHVDAATFLRAVVTNAWKHAVANLGALAEGAGDDAIVHQARVGLRRLRTALRLVAELVPDAVAPDWQGALRAGFIALGAHRDADVVLPAVRARLPAAGMPLFADPLPESLPRPLVEIARDPALQLALLDVLGLVQRPLALSVLAGRPAAAVVAERLEALQARLERDARRYTHLDAARRHAVRKRLKRHRYLSEFAAPLFGAKAVGRFLRHWRDAQDALGVANDEQVAAGAWRRHAEHEPAAWFAVGWLAACETQAVHACSRALRRAAKAKAFWRAR